PAAAGHPRRRARGQAGPRRLPARRRPARRGAAALPGGRGLRPGDRGGAPGGRPGRGAPRPPGRPRHRRPLRARRAAAAGTVRPGRRHGAVRRSRATLTLYASLACLGYLLNGLGVVRPQLRDELGLSRAEVATYPSAFALGLLGVGVVGERVARALGRRALPAALAAGAAGALLLASGVDRLLSAAGALLLGVGGAGLVQLVPAGLRAEHGQLAAVAIGEANATASATSVLAPLLVAASLRAGAGWRAGYLVLPLAGVALLLASLRRPRGSAAADAGAGRRPDPSPPAAFLGH